MGYGGGGGGGSGGGGGGSGGGGGGTGYGGASGAGGYSGAAAPQAGAFRFNTDSSQLEIYDGNQWTGVLATSPNQQTGGTRGLFLGGSNEPDPSATYNIIDYINIASTGNAIDFGDFSSTTQEGAALASSTRGIYFGGDPATNTITFVTIASTGDMANFGDLLTTSKHGIGGADRTRGIMFIGSDGSSRVNTINYITTASTGDAVDFGDATDENYDGAGMCSPTRMVAQLGSNDAGSWTNAIDYVTISTTGNAADFGDQSGSYNARCGYSNAVRGVIHGAYQYPASPNHTNSIDYVTLATLGNAQDFGDSSGRDQGGGVSSSTRGCAGGGYDNGTSTIAATIDYVQIMTTGNAIDFGDLTQKRRHVQGASNGHGGL